MEIGESIPQGFGVNWPSLKLRWRAIPRGYVRGRTTFPILLYTQLQFPFLLAPQGTELPGSAVHLLTCLSIYIYNI